MKAGQATAFTGLSLDASFTLELSAANHNKVHVAVVFHVVDPKTTGDRGPSILATSAKPLNAKPAYWACPLSLSNAASIPIGRIPVLDCFPSVSVNHRVV